MSTLDEPNPTDQPINVLIVDDDVVDRKLIKRLLKNVVHCRYSVDEAETSSRARTLLDCKNYDIALIDYVLGASTGIELIQDIVRKENSIPCIMLTGMNNPEYDDMALKAGASDFLSKEDLSSRLLERIIRYAIHRTELANQLDHLAHYDGLTGLINRNLFLDRFSHAAESAKRNGFKHALIFADIDYFKLVNDEYGHAAGDKVLEEVSKRLLLSVRTNDTVARFGGDEFVILLENIDRPYAHLVAQRILQSMETKVFLGNGNRVLSPQLSLGLACFPTKECSTENALAEADRALTQAKQGGRNTYRSFGDELLMEARRAIRLERDLRTAIEQKEIILHYQPQIILNSGSLRGFEALARWHHVELGWIPPVEFIPLAEKLSLIPALSEHVLEIACTQQMVWERQCPGLIMSVNISATQCSSQNLIHTLEDILEKTDISPHNLELELTESALLGHPEKSLAILKNISEKGVGLAIDDFGTGYSSLQYLTAIPLDVLKIDRCFVQGIGNNNKQELIINTIIDLAKNLNLSVVAEGVETKSQDLFISKNGCQLGQGYLYSKPKAAADCETLIRQTLDYRITSKLGQRS